MGVLYLRAVKGRRSLVLAACLSLVAAGALIAGGPLSFASSPRSGPSGVHFDPRSVTFVSVHTGWVLGTVRCSSGDGCPALRETTDGGRSWFSRQLPGPLVAAADREVGGGPATAGLHVRFADPKDGWIYGGLAVSVRRSGVSSVSIQPTLWSTHDGGLSWRKQPLRGLGPQDSIFDLDAAGGMAYLMESNDAGGVTVKSSPVGQDSWHVSNTVHLDSPAGGGEQSGAFTLRGSSGWLVEGNDRGTTGSARLDNDGRWGRWTPPCASVGHSLAAPAASTPRDLVAVCVMGGFAYPLSRSAPPGATLGSSWLYFSDDGGRTFHAGPELQRHAYASSEVLASPTPRTILIGRDNGGSQDLQASFDGGARWTVVYRGQLESVGFTSPSQGAAIVKPCDRSRSGSCSIPSNATTTMIMTFDGGHHWAPVSF